MRVDIHQHLWTPGLLEALAARDQRPFIRKRDGLCVLHATGEQPGVLDAPQDLTDAAELRIAQLDRDHVERAVIAISTPIGIETLPRAQALALIDVHLDGVLALGPRFAAWGPLAVAEPDPDDVDRLLGRGCVGIAIPATAVADRRSLDRLLPALQRVQERAVPLFVHPGTPVGEPALGDPLWWAALTEYVAQMQAAWLTFVVFGRRELPNLTVVFAMLAGFGPSLAERLVARGGPSLDPRDPGIFYETSSNGPLAVEAMARWLGPDRLVYGSDRPVIEPVPTGREDTLMRNAALLIQAGAPA